MMSSRELRKAWKNNLQQASKDLIWEKEAEKLRDVYREAGLVFPAIPQFP
jgi:hypothetical protein